MVTIRIYIWHTEQTQIGQGDFSKTASQPAMRKAFIKLVVIGDSNVGKTALINQFEHARFFEQRQSQQYFRAIAILVKKLINFVVSYVKPYFKPALFDEQKSIW